MLASSCTHHLYHKFVQQDNRPFRVRTGGGYTSCQQYIIFSIVEDGITTYNNKFYVIPDLPFDYLIGRPLLTKLGYDLIKIKLDSALEYHHQREDLDSLSDEDMVRHPYPVNTHSKIKQTQPTPKIASRNKKFNTSGTHY